MCYAALCRCNPIIHSSIFAYSTCILSLKWTVRNVYPENFFESVKDDLGPGHTKTLNLMIHFCPHALREITIMWNLMTKYSKIYDSVFSLSHSSLTSSENSHVTEMQPFYLAKHTSFITIKQCTQNPRWYPVSYHDINVIFTETE